MCVKRPNNAEDEGKSSKFACSLLDIMLKFRRLPWQSFFWFEAVLSMVLSAYCCFYLSRSPAVVIRFCKRLSKVIQTYDATKMSSALFLGTVLSSYSAYFDRM